MEPLTADESPSLLVFGSQTATPSEAVLRDVRRELIQNSCLTALKDELIGLPEFWERLVHFDPNLESISGERHVGPLKQWIEDDKPLRYDDRPLPAHVALALTVLVQICQYSRYLRHVGAYSHRTLLGGPLLAGGIQGHCVGFLSAIAVASSETEGDIGSFAAMALRIAVSAGAYVDQDGSCSSPSAEYTAVVVTIPGDGKHDEELTGLVRSFTDAYVSSINDVGCLTITLRASDVKPFVKAANARQWRAKTITVHGRFHNSQHTAAVETLDKFFKTVPCPKTARLQAPVRDPGTGEVLSKDYEIRSALENILVKVPNWYGTIQAALRSVSSTHPVIACVGPNNSIPASLAQRTNVRALILVNHGLTRSHSSHDASSRLQTAIGLTNSTTDQDLHNSSKVNDAGASNGSGYREVAADGGNVDTHLVDLDQYPPHSIAVVGMSGRFPGAGSLDELWELIREGRSTVETAPVERLGLSSTRDNGDTKWWGNFLKEPHQFDHKFFNKSSREALAWDPQQRILLEVIYEALESAAYFGPSRSAEPRDYGCYIGAVMNNYYDNLSCHPPTAYATVGTSRCYLSGAMSHYFGWTGPSLTIDTACSSSLVAIHTACQAIWSGDCSRAVAGGTNVISSPFDYQNLAAAGFLSPSGQCKPFDADADGYCRGEGVAAVVLKPLADAIADEDNIHGVIAGSAINQNDNCGAITAPVSASQADLYRRVLRSSGVEASSVSYVEAHGTGTGVGDPVEVRSIRDAFGGRDRSQTLNFGSIKGNIGHAESTAGIAGLLKVLLMMRHRTIPAQASHTHLNPQIPPLDQDRMAIARTPTSWQAPTLLACVNSYGAAGSNATVMVRQRPSGRKTSGSPQLTSYPMFISAGSPTSISAFATSLLEWLRTPEQVSTKLLGSLAFGLAARGNHKLPYRFATGVRSILEADKWLESVATRPAEPSKFDQARKPVVVVFGGQEASHVGLSQDLYESCKTFSRHLDSVDQLLQRRRLGCLFPLIYQSTPIEDVVLLHAALFAVQYASAQSWIDCGLEISAVVGHSFGQLTALCISGVLSLEDALDLVTGRASLIKKYWATERGAMLSVQASRSMIERVLAHFLSEHEDYAEIACYNGPESHVIVGSSTAIEALQEHIARAHGNIRTKRLTVTNGFHSCYTEPLLPHLSNLAGTLEWNRPRIHLETTTELESSSNPSSRLISEHTRRPVFFQQAIERLEARCGACTWIEAGRGSSMIQLAKRSLTTPSKHSFYSPQLCSPDHAQDSLTDVIVGLWNDGYAVQHWPFHRLQKAEYQYLNLPSYQFDAYRHWLGYTRTPPKQEDTSTKAICSKQSVHELLSFATYIDNAETEARFRIDPQSERFKTLLAGHVMAGECLAPASLFYELAACAALFLEDDISAVKFIPTVEELSMTRPLGPSEKKQISMFMKRCKATPSAWTFCITSRELDEGVSESFEHVTGRVILQSRTVARISRLFQRYETLIGAQKHEELFSHPESERMQGSHIYRAFSTIVQYSKPFHGIQSVACVRNEASGKVAYAPNRSLTASQRLSNTPMIDSFMQFAGFLINYFNNPTLDDVFVCGKIEHVEMGGAFDPDAGQWLVYSNMRSHDNSAEMISDVYVFDAATKKMVMAAFGFHFSKIRRCTLGRMLKAVNQSTKTDKRSRDIMEDDSFDETTQSEQGINLTPQRNGIASNRQEILRVLSDITDVSISDIRDHTTLDDLGVDSLMGVEVLNDLRAATGVTIALPSFLLLDNVKALIDHVDEKLGICSAAPDNPARSPVSKPSEKPMIDLGVASPNTQVQSINTNDPDQSQCKHEVKHIPTLPTSRKAFRETRLNYDAHAETTQAAGFWEKAYPFQARLVLAYVVEAFAELGSPLNKLQAGDTLPGFTVLPRHRRLLGQLHRVLEDGKLIISSKDGQTYHRTEMPTETSSAESIYQEVINRFPQHSCILKLVRIMGSKLFACLKGAEDPLQILFGQPETKRLQEEMYEFWPLLRTPTLVLGDFLGQALSPKVSDEGKFRILEVGAGTGGTTRYIVDHLRNLGVDFEYVVTDVSPSLVKTAAKHFAGDDCLLFDTLDIEQPPKPDYLDAFHCIISTNCIHATKDLDVSLRHLRQMLRDDGVLSLIEITQNMFWLDVVVGMLPGWWLFEDGREHALIDEKDWERKMLSAGFDEVMWSDGAMPEAKTVRVITAFNGEASQGEMLNTAPSLMGAKDHAATSIDTTYCKAPALSTVSTTHQDTYPFISPFAIEDPQPDLAVLVTGASKGIGLATAISFATAGFARIALLARSDLSTAEAKVLQAAKYANRPVPRVLRLQGSISDKHAVAEAMQKVDRAFEGRLDILINNASRLSTWQPLDESDADDWWETWETNVKGTYLMTRAALPLLLRSAYKTVLNITSGGALVSLPGASAYQGTKAAQVRLIECLMAEYGSQGLIAYAVHPCGTKTESTAAMPEHMHFLLNETPELAADTIVWLTKERREWLAGRFVYGPADMQELSSKKDEVVQQDLLKLKLAV